MLKPIFITGIGTGVGKTVTSAIVTEHLKADYWKPIQSGDLENSDTITVKQLVSNDKTYFHPEVYKLTQPLSPHLSARLDGIEIDINTIKIPETQNTLVIEGAGGLMVPLNQQFLIIDLIAQLQAEVILVSQHYLGSINHTLLSYELLKSKNIPVKGILFNGHNPESEAYITQYTKLKHLGTIPVLNNLDKNSVKEAGKHLTL